MKELSVIPKPFKNLVRSFKADIQFVVDGFSPCPYSKTSELQGLASSVATYIQLHYSNPLFGYPSKKPVSDPKIKMKA